MANNAMDVSELQRALNETAGKASVLWTTFVTFELYLAIAFGSVTHRDLFLNTPIKLPVLNVELPLVGFFLVAPSVLLIFHFYVFLQLLALANKAKNYSTVLRLAAPLESDRQFLRQRTRRFSGPAVPGRPDRAADGTRWSVAPAHRLDHARWRSSGHPDAGSGDIPAIPPLVRHLAAAGRLVL